MSSASKSRPADMSARTVLTGGTGAVGSLVALWLAGHAAKRIVLLGRSGRFSADSPLAAYRCAAQRCDGRVSWAIMQRQVNM
jgi:predicted amino acid dehydrogenase